MNDLDLKNKIILLIVILGGVISFFITPLEKNLSLKKEIKNYSYKLKNSDKKISIVKNKLLEAEKELGNLQIEEKSMEEKVYKFNSTSQGNLYINNLIEKNNLEVLEIGRIERMEKSIFIPYKIIGREENIIKFIEKVENENKIFLLNSSFELLKENELLKISFRGNYFVEENEKIINEGERKNLSGKKFWVEKVEFINDNVGIIELLDKKIYINREKIIEIYGNNYIFRIENKKLTIGEKIL